MFGYLGIAYKVFIYRNLIRIRHRPPVFSFVFELESGAGGIVTEVYRGRIGVAWDVPAGRSWSAHDDESELIVVLSANRPAPSRIRLDDTVRLNPAHSQNDPAKLDQWIVRAVSAGSVAEVLGTNGKPRAAKQRAGR